MNTEIQSLISGLLEKAVAKATITNRYTKQTVDINWFRRSLRSTWTRHLPVADINHPTNFQVSIDDQAVMERLMGALELALKGKTQDNRVQTATWVTVLGYGPGFELEMLAKRLLVVAIGRGHQQATRNLMRGIQDGVAEYKVFGLLAGIRVDSEIEVRPGIRLVPLPSNSANLPPLLGSMGHNHDVDLLSGTVIVIDHTVSPVYKNPDDSISLPDDGFHRKQRCSELTAFDLENFCIALSLITNGAIECVHRWTFIEPDEVFVVHGQNADSPLTKISGLRERESVQVDSEQVERAVSLYTAMKNLQEGDAKKLKIPITRWIKSKTEQPLEDTVIDLGIALESLYLDKGNGDQQSFRLRLRAALFLKESVEERKTVIADVQKIYGLRSKAVHTGDVRYDAANNSVKEKAEELCRDSIIKSIHHARTNGHLPNWSHLELGEKLEIQGV